MKIRKNKRNSAAKKPAYELRLVRNVRDRDSLPYVICTCGDFRTEASENLMALGLAAKAHALETGHRFRRHD